MAVAKVAIYHFQNDQGLSREGGDYFLQTDNSGQPLFYKDVFGKFSNLEAVMSHKLEMSNVDLSGQFTDMITTQRGFQANSRVITTTDEMLQELVNLKR